MVALGDRHFLRSARGESVAFSRFPHLTLPNIPAVPPSKFPVGTTVAFTYAASDYPSADGWTLKYGVAGAGQLSVAASGGSGGDYTVTLPQESNALAPGTYQWSIWVERTSPAVEKVELERGIVLVQADVSAAEAGDQQLTDEQELELIETTIAARLRGDMAEYGLQGAGGDGRSAKREDLATLYKIRAQLRSRLARKRRGGRMRQIAVGFTRPC